MKHCIDCKYFGGYTLVLGAWRTPFTEEEVLCVHPDSIKGEPSMVLKKQQYNTCYHMRRLGGCGIQASLHEEKN